MKKLGIVGGIGWPSTIEYYRNICELSQKYHSDKEFSGSIPMPEISIESLNMNFTINNRGSSEPGSWKIFDTYFNEALKRLESVGVDLIIIASVTPHARLDEISRGIGVPILSIYEAIGSQCGKQDIEQLLVLGTMPTMTSFAFIEGVKDFDVRVLYPPTDELKETVLEIIQQLYQNNTQGTSTAINELVRSCISEKELGSTAVCLGCTELPIAFQDFTGELSFTVEGITYLNASVIHANEAFQVCLKKC